MATHSCILAWKIPWTEDPGRLQSMGSQRVGHNSDFTSQTHCSLRIDNVNPWDTTFLPHHQSVRIVHELITHPGTPLPHLVFNNALLQGHSWWPSGSDCTSSVGGVGSIPGWGAKILHAMCCTPPNLFVIIKKNALLQ